MRRDLGIGCCRWPRSHCMDGQANHDGSVEDLGVGGRLIHG